MELDSTLNRTSQSELLHIATCAQLRTIFDYLLSSKNTFIDMRIIIDIAVGSKQKCHTQIHIPASIYDEFDVCFFISQYSSYYLFFIYADFLCCIRMIIISLYAYNVHYKRTSLECDFINNIQVFTTNFL